MVSQDAEAGTSSSPSSSASTSSPTSSASTSSPTSALAVMAVAEDEPVDRVETATLLTPPLLGGEIEAEEAAAEKAGRPRRCPPDNGPRKCPPDNGALEGDIPP